MKLPRLICLAIAFLIMTFSNTETSARNNNEEYQPTPRQHQPETNTFEVSDEELKKFARAAEKVEQLRLKSREQLKELTVEYDMTLNEYRRLSRQAQDPARSQVLSDETIEKLKRFRKALTKLQSEMDRKMQKEVREAGLDMLRYQQIVSAMQQDKNLRKKVNRYMNG